MTSKNQNKKQIAQETSKTPFKVKRYLPLIAVVTIMVVGLVMGASILWEKRLEDLVKVDLPHEDQETSETSSIVPYICNNDPEACEDEPLTFKGSEDEEKVTAELEVEERVEWPTIHYPEKSEPTAEDENPMVDMLRGLPLMKEVEAKLQALEDIEPMQQKVEILSLLAILESTMDGQVSTNLLERALDNSKFEELRALATLVPEGSITPFDQLDVYDVVSEETDESMDERSVWEQLLVWGKSLIEIRTIEEREALEATENFKKACELGNYDKAFAYYERMSSHQRQAYGEWASEIRKRKKLIHLNEILLQFMVGGV